MTNFLPEQVKIIKDRENGMKKQNYQTPGWEKMVCTMQDVIATSGTTVPENETEVSFGEFGF